MKRFCSYKGHKTSRIDDKKLDEAVSSATDMVSIIAGIPGVLEAR